MGGQLGGHNTAYFTIENRGITTEKGGVCTKKR